MASIDAAAEQAPREDRSGTEGPSVRTCRLCHRELPADTKGRVKGKTFQCRSCLTLTTLLYRNQGPGTLDRWSAEQKVKFFQRCAACVDERVSWETVRSVVIETETHSRVQQKVTQVTQESLPLGVWLQRGYTEQAVLQFATEEDPKLGQLYAVPVQADIWREVQETVEKEVLEREKAISQKSCGKRKKGDAEAEALDLDVAAAPKALPAPKKAAKGAPAAALTGQTPRQMEAARRKQETNNQKCALFAAQHVGTLSTCVAALEKAHAQGEKAKLEPDLLRQAVDALGKLQPWKKACQDIVHLAEATKGLATPLGPLDFTKVDVKDTVKAANRVVSDIRSTMRALKPEKPEKGERSKKSKKDN